MTAKSILSKNFTEGQRELEPSGHEMTRAEQIAHLESMRDGQQHLADSWKDEKPEWAAMHQGIANKYQAEIDAIGNIVGTISRAAEISLDANGEFRQPYSSYPRRKSSVMSTQEAEYMFGDDWRDLDF